MCGIVGALDLEGRREFPAEALARMAASVRHRGPDDAAMWSEPGISMATQRLAIVDVAGGRQPFCDAEGRAWAACNGEIFNYEELRAGLVQRGHRLRTRCDAELWPGLFVEHGPEMLGRVRGQFAVAVWDRRERTLLLARDRVGVCPLHWAVVDGWLLWGSEIKALLASGLVRAEVDFAGVDHVFSLFAAGTRRTCFRGVESLWPGHCMVVRGGQRSVRRYWDLEFPEGDAGRRDAGAVEEMEACLEAAVRDRLRSDGPVATYLSGGLDSTLLLGLAARASEGPRTAFTIGFDGAGPDERPRAIRAAEELGARLQVLVPPAGAIAGALPQVVEAAEAPIMDTADACLALLAEEVRARGFKVVLTGEGADEAMGGYIWHRTHRLLRGLGRVHRAIPALIREGLGRLMAPGTAAPGFADRLGGLRPALLDVHEPLARARFLLYADEAARRAAAHDPWAELDVDPARMRRWHPLHQSLYVEYKLMLPGHLLHGKGDRVAMRAGVECRYPFLDERFVALAAGLAPGLKLGPAGARGRGDKLLLRQVARRVLPAAIADPPKGMFKANALCRLAPQPAWVEQLTSEASLRATGMFCPRRVAHERRLQQVLPAWAPRRFVVDASWTAMVTTQLWHHLFVGGGLCELPQWQPPAPAGLARV